MRSRSGRGQRCNHQLSQSAAGAACGAAGEARQCCYWCEGSGGGGCGALLSLEAVVSPGDVALDMVRQKGQGQEGQDERTPQIKIRWSVWVLLLV